MPRVDWGTSNEYPQHMFSLRNKKITYLINNPLLSKPMIILTKISWIINLSGATNKHQNKHVNYIHYWTGWHLKWYFVFAALCFSKPENISQQTFSITDVAHVYRWLCTAETSHNTDHRFRYEENIHKIVFLFLHKNICCGYSLASSSSIRRFYWIPHHNYVFMKKYM